jgi:hypothetical protein
MRLTNVQITNYRSAEDSGDFSIDRGVTCLVGKNEAGKSAVLLALASVNPHAATPIVLNKERDYPRRFLTAYAQRHPEQEAIVAATAWELSPEEIDAIIQEFGDVLVRMPVEGVAAAPRPPQVKVIRRYNTPEPEWLVEIDLRKALDHLLVTGEFDEAQLPLLQSAKSEMELRDLIQKIPQLTEKQRAILDKLSAAPTITTGIINILKPRLPFFMYFSTYDRMDGAVQSEHIQSLKSNGQLQLDANRGQRLFHDFLHYAGAPLEEVTNVRTYETFNARLQAA